MDFYNNISQNNPSSSSNKIFTIESQRKKLCKNKLTHGIYFHIARTDISVNLSRE